MKHICFNNKKNNYGHVMDVTMHLMLCLTRWLMPKVKSIQLIITFLSVEGCLPDSLFSS